MDTKNPTLPPGLADLNVEFYYRDGNIFILHNGQNIPFEDVPVEILDKVRKQMDHDPIAMASLALLKIDDPVDQLKKFIECRYGDFNMEPDIDTRGRENPEYFECGIRGTCPVEGKLCNSIMAPYGTITKREADIIKLVVQDLADKEIAERLNISYNTVTSHRSRITQKIGAASKVGITRFALEKNII